MFPFKVRRGPLHCVPQGRIVLFFPVWSWCWIVKGGGGWVCVPHLIFLIYCFSFYEKFLLVFTHLLFWISAHLIWFLGMALPFTWDIALFHLAYCLVLFSFWRHYPSQCCVISYFVSCCCERCCRISCCCESCCWWWSLWCWDCCFETLCLIYKNIKLIWFQMRVYCYRS